MRTPPRPGRYTPGSTVTHMSAAMIPAPVPRQTRRFVDLQADAVAEAVGELVAVARVDDHVAGRRVDAAYLRAGAARRRPAACAAATRS